MARTEDYKLGEFTFPRGWFMVADSSKVGGKPLSERFWANKRPALDIVQVPTDGPFAKSRIWYERFYNPRAKTAEFLTRVQGLHAVEGCPTVTPVAAE